MIISKIEKNKEKQYSEESPDPEKYKQMILAFLRKGGRMSPAKLASLLYLADFNNFYKNQKSMSGMEYRKIKEGEVEKYFADKYNKNK